MISKITNLCLSLFLVSSLIGCSRTSVLKECTYRYSMESINNFKVEFELNPDSTYKINQHNYFFDKFEGKSKPLFRKGKLSQDEFDQFGKLISRSKLEQMEDSYGFVQGGDIDNSVVYMIELKQNQKSKFISVNAAADTDLPEDFNRLIAFTVKFIGDKIELAE